MKIALAQINPTVGDFQGNTQKIIDFARQAGAAGPAMITRRPGAGGRPIMSRPVPAPGKVTAGIATVMSDSLRRETGIVVFVGVGFGGADTESD